MPRDLPHVPNLQSGAHVQSFSIPTPFPHCERPHACLWAPSLCIQTLFISPAHSYLQPGFRPKGTHSGCASALQSLGQRSEQTLGSRMAWDERKFQNPERYMCDLEGEVARSLWARAPDFWPSHPGSLGDMPREGPNRALFCPQ